MQHPFTNQLIHETSPYLLQHAHNPVNWFPWGEEAFNKARAENKVILVSIGYAACHWCHVMERESFEDEVTADIMNRHFVNIKIDREERPDIDHIYMDAVQAMTGSGGWPLNVFLTPEAKPFYGGTYFPPVRAFNRESWKEVLYGVSGAWTNRKDEIEAQAEQLTGHLEQSNNFGQTTQVISGIQGDDIFTADLCHTMFANIMKAADKQWGGFGKAPKFPQTFTINYLLQYYHFSANIEALEQAKLSLDKMLEGGLYDQAGGGFSRYSTDEEWLAPHFEKMLYDNALLLMVLADAYAITKDENHAKKMRQTIAFLEREMIDPEGGFYAALDADSEGKEGKFYVWKKEEIDQILNEDSPLFCTFFDVNEKGNWEGENILRTLKKSAIFAEEKVLDHLEFETKIDRCLDKILSERSKRIRPATDDKILLGWNALMITALCKSSAAMGDEGFKKLAIETFDFVWEKFQDGNNGLYHTYKNGVAKYPAFLDDYAYLLQACIHLQEVTSNQDYLIIARKITEYVIENFSVPDSAYFFYTGKNQTDVIVRKKEVYDGATASGNSVMADNLQYLGIIFDNRKWSGQAIEMLTNLSVAIVKHPTSFAVWGAGILKQVIGWNEIAIVGENYAEIRDQITAAFIPNKLIQSGEKETREFPLLAEKKTEAETQIYLCKNYACMSPFTHAKDLLQVIAEKDQKLTTAAQ